VTDRSAGQGAPPTASDEEIPKEFEEIYERFDKRTRIGDWQFLVRSWPAWVVAPKKKTLVPVVRLYIADLDGNIIAERPVVLPGLLDLMEEFAEIFVAELARLVDMGYSVDTPVTKSELLERVKGLSDVLAKSIETADKLTFITTGSGKEPPDGNKTT
jgi:hypothetical protein